MFPSASPPLTRRAGLLALSLVAFLGALLLAGPDASAGVDTWTPLTARVEAGGGFGPDPQPDGSLDLEIAGSLFVSTDGGETWERRVEPDFPPGTGRYQRHPSEGRIEAGYGGGFQDDGLFAVLYESLDGGRTWEAVDGQVFGVVRPSWAAGTRYGVAYDWDRDGSSCNTAASAGSRSAVSAPTSGPWVRSPYLVRSVDQGETWERVYCAFAVEGVGWIPGAPQQLLVRPEHYIHSPPAPLGAWSGDGGRTWKDLDVLPLQLLTPSDPTRSAPAGAFLTFLDVGPDPDAFGLMRVVPGGPPYEKVFDGLVLGIAADPRVPDRLLLAAEDERLYESRDDGRSWQVLSEGPELDGLAGVAVTLEGRLVVPTGLGVRLSDDDGRTWRAPPTPPLDAVEVRVDLADSRVPGLLYGWAGSRLVRSMDGGTAWELYDAGLPPTRWPQVIFRRGESLFLVLLDDHITTYRRALGGDEWVEVSSVDLSTIGERRTTPCPSEGLYTQGYCSVDGGRTWRRVPGSIGGVRTAGSGRQFRLAGPTGVETRPDEEGVWQRGLLAAEVDDLAADPHGDGALVVSDGGAVFLWQGGAWSPRVQLPEACSPHAAFAVAYHPTATQWRYVVGDGCFAFSRDGGGEWWIESGHHARSRLPRLVVDPHDPRRLYGGSGSLLLAGAEPLLLGPEGRFRVTAAWTDFAGGTGPAHPRPLTEDTGAFWFFGEDNLELVLKVLDGGAINQRYWVFYGALSNVAYEVTVFDRLLGSSAHYVNPPRVFASRGDTEALPRPPQEPSVPALSSGSATPILASAAVEAPPLLLQDGRFEVRVEWEDFQGNAGVGKPVDLTGDTGYFWFFGRDNVELVVKVLDARSLDGHWWVFAGALSNVAWRLTVTDTHTGEEQVYENPARTFASFADTAAFED